MTNEQIKYSIETGELKLDSWQKFTHYGIVFYILIVPAIFIFIHLKNYLFKTYVPFREDLIWFLIIPPIIAFQFYKLQKRRLKLKTIHNRLTREEIDLAIENVAKELDWKPSLINNKIIIAKTYPGFLSGSWGEQITILFDKKKILINSICDPDNRSSVISFGRNKKNTQRLIKEIQDASR
jgi:hypothetical protein